MRVLDVGCSNGALSSEIKDRFPSAYVVGLEYDRDLADEARTKLDQVVVADLDLVSELSLNDGNFDLLIFADVLEHTKYPKQVLKSLLKLAAPKAIVLISLPNVQHWTALYELLLGRWPEKERGLFDKTHLRWFTRKSIIELATECDLSIMSVGRNFRILDRPGGRVNQFSRYAGYLPLKNFFTYQYLVVLEVQG